MREKREKMLVVALHNLDQCNISPVRERSSLREVRGCERLFHSNHSYKKKQRASIKECYEQLEWKSVSGPLAPLTPVLSRLEWDFALRVIHDTLRSRFGQELDSEPT